MPASRQSAFLIAALTKMRSTFGSSAARLDHGEMAGRPDLRIDVLLVGGDHVGRGHLLALLARERRSRHRGEPDVGIEPDLVAAVAGEHRPAARLRHVADQQAGPVRHLRHLRGEPLHERDQLRMAPVAVARQPHHLPGPAVDRQRDAAGEAALGIEADRARLHVGRAPACGRTIPWRGFSDRPGWRAAAAVSD